MLEYFCHSRVVYSRTGKDGRPVDTLARVNNYTSGYIERLINRISHITHGSITVFTDETNQIPPIRIINMLKIVGITPYTRAQQHICGSGHVLVTSPITKIYRSRRLICYVSGRFFTIEDQAENYTARVIPNPRVNTSLNIPCANVCGLGMERQA
jgi:hypothetical protein